VIRIRHIMEYLQAMLRLTYLGPRPGFLVASGTAMLDD
jgi:hypothetical protein